LEAMFLLAVQHGKDMSCYKCQFQVKELL
jgi:hypothetical protein